MLDIGGVLYMVDLNAMDKMLSLESASDDKMVIEKEITKTLDKEGNVEGIEELTKEYFRGKEINGPKYDMIRMFFEVILTYNEELDDELGIDRALGKTTLPFKLAFNSLLEYGIIREIEE